MKRSVKLFAALALLLLTLIIVRLVFIKTDKLTSPFPFKFMTPPNLASVVKDSMKDFQGKYGVLVKNLKTGETYGMNDKEFFEAGSLYKLWVMEAVFEKIKEGKLGEDDNLEADVKDLNLQLGVATSEAELKEGRLQFTISSALEQMITISHNYAALMLFNKVDSSGIPTKVTAKDVALFFERLYKGEIIDSDYSKRMIDILSRQKIADRIPKYLPEGTKVAHKTADFGFFEHDGGIVFSEKGDYIIVLLTESSSPADADESIAQISKAVYDYFSRK